jgi:hypothetical protein
LYSFNKNIACNKQLKNKTNMAKDTFVCVSQYLIQIEKWHYTHVINIAQMGRHSNRFLQQKRANVNFHFSSVAGRKVAPNQRLNTNLQPRVRVRPTSSAAGATRSSNK